MASDNYENLPIGLGQIRLLILHGGSYLTPIECDLKVYDLPDVCEPVLEAEADDDDAGNGIGNAEHSDVGFHYEALSYVWGDADDTLPISLGGCEIRITRNLESALRGLRRQQAQADRVLWVDALCINQGSVAERNVQVRQMGKIYRQAYRVYAWLGSGSSATQMAAGHIKALGEDPVQHWHSSERVNVAHWYDLSYLDGIVSLLNHPWWTRVWTFQEAILARRLWFCCGGETGPFFNEMPLGFSRQCLLAFITSFWEHGATCCPQLLGYGDIGRKTIRVQGMFQERDWALEGGGAYLIDSIDEEGYRECSVVHDRIYGYLGLLETDTHEKIPEADYSLPAAEAFKVFVLWFIQRFCNLDILSLAEADGPGSDTCSWTPGLPPHGYSSLWHNRHVRFLPRVEFRASGEVFDTVSRLGPDMLCITGVLCDYVDLVVPRGPGEELFPDFALWWRALSLEIKSHERYAAKGSLRNAFHHLILQSGSGFGLRTPENPVPPWFEDYLLGRSQSQRFSKEDRDAFYGAYYDRVVQLFASCNTGPYHLGACVHLEASLQQGTSERCLIATKRGYIGLAPKTVQQNDKICVLYGGRRPFVLREAKTILHTEGAKHTGHILVGDSHIHGIMDGEAMEMLAEGELEEQSFYLV